VPMILRLTILSTA